MTKIKDMPGFVVTPKYMGTAKITVRFTSDDHGESISLECGGIMFEVPFESVEQIIKEARGHDETGN